MSAPLGRAVLVAGPRSHTLRRIRLEDLNLTTDLQAFRAPFGTRWHKLGTGHAEPELIHLSGVIEGVTLPLARATLDALHADLPAITILRIGAWNLTVNGSVGPLVVTPTPRGYRVQLALVRP